MAAWVVALDRRLIALLTECVAFALQKALDQRLPQVTSFFEL
jgi:hypothetical protein